jgi:hypothetical protein
MTLFKDPSGRAVSECFGAAGHGRDVSRCDLLFVGGVEGRVAGSGSRSRGGAICDSS